MPEFHVWMTYTNRRTGKRVEKCVQERFPNITAARKAALIRPANAKGTVQVAIKRWSWSGTIDLVQTNFLEA